MPTKPNKRNWHLCISIAVFLAILSFTPLVIPSGVYRPYALGMPFTLWMTILITILFVILTFVATKVHPGRNEEGV